MLEVSTEVVMVGFVVNSLIFVSSTFAVFEPLFVHKAITYYIIIGIATAKTRKRVREVAESTVFSYISAIILTINQYYIVLVWYILLLSLFGEVINIFTDTVTPQ